jgi:hypothetical protein
MAIMFKDAYATYWGTQEEKEKYATVKVSTGDKQKDGSYVNTNWFARFVGKAFEKLNQLESKDKIKISGKVSNPYNKDDKKSYLNLVVFDFEFSDTTKNTSAENEKSDSSDDETLPFD